METTASSDSPRSLAEPTSAQLLRFCSPALGLAPSQPYSSPRRADAMSGAPLPAAIAPPLMGSARRPGICANADQICWDSTVRAEPRGIARIAKIAMIAEIDHFRSGHSRQFWQFRRFWQSWQLLSAVAVFLFLCVALQR